MTKLLEQNLNFREQVYAINAQSESAFKQGAVRELGFAFDGTATGSVAITLSDEAPWRNLGSLQLIQFGAPRINVDAYLLFHLAAIYQGGYVSRNAGTATSTTFGSRFVLPLHTMLDGAGFDATGAELIWRWTNRSHTFYGANATAVAGIVRPWAHTAPEVPQGGFNTPDFFTAEVSLASASSNIPLQLDFKTDVYGTGLLVEASDATGGAGAEASASVDGLIRRLAVDYIQPGEPRKSVYDWTVWGRARYETCRASGFGSDDEIASTGIVFIPLKEMRQGRKRNALFIPAGGQLTIYADNSAAVEGDITAVTPAAGDKMRVTVIAFDANTDTAIDGSPTQLSSNAAQPGTSAARRQMSRAQAIIGRRNGR